MTKKGKKMEQVMTGLFMGQRWYKEKEALMTSKEDIRDNVIHYDDEGGGEEDTRAYDMGTLRTGHSQCTSIQSDASKKNRPSYGEGVLLHLSCRKGDTRSPDIHQHIANSISAPNKSSTLRSTGGKVSKDNTKTIRSFIEQTLGEGQHAALPYDSLATYAYEGDGSVAGSLSSIEESWVLEDMGDFSSLGDWGQPFKTLASILDTQPPTLAENSSEELCFRTL